jgi:NADH:ubiquinone oxidoreductase subunit 3 (subunit A)
MEFAPISVYLVISLILSLILVGVSFLFSSSSNLAYPEKLSAYECGFDPFDDARSRFDIRFYLVSILFIIFGATVSYQVSVPVDACRKANTTDLAQGTCAGGPKPVVKEDH